MGCIYCHVVYSIVDLYSLGVETYGERKNEETGQWALMYTKKSRLLVAPQ